MFIETTFMRCDHGLGGGGGEGLVGIALIPRTLKRCPLSLHTCNRLLKDFDVRSKRCAWRWMYDCSQRGIGCKNCVWCCGQKQTSRQARHLYQSFKLIGADKGGVYIKFGANLWQTRTHIFKIDFSSQQTSWVVLNVRFQVPNCF